MQGKTNVKNRENYPGLEPAYTILGEILKNLESTDGKRQEVLESSLDKYDQARDIFLSEDQPWSGAWVDLQKASLHCELAEGANYIGRGVQVHTAMTLINNVLEVMPDLTPSLDLTAKLYISMLETLFRIRSLYEKPDQLEAIDEFIQGVSENLGGALAMDLSMRAEANDLICTAKIIEALADLEDETGIKEDMLETSMDLSQQAAGNQAVCSPIDLSMYSIPREDK